ncbi:hypothetical protein FGRMN_11131 [Fusarium graminum]|nr:hypothetical protein FGRMN_11131 [Fusarium graminum]
MSLPIQVQTSVSKDPNRLHRPYLRAPGFLGAGALGRIVVLNGFPGAGKHTIIKRIRELLDNNTTCLFDNHLIIDPVVAIFPERGDSNHHTLRRAIQAPIFKALGKRASEGDTILMTASLAAGLPRDVDSLQDYLSISRENRVPIYWINVHCDSDILEKRLSTPERQQGSKTKLTDVHILRGLLESHELIDPKAIGGGNSSTRLVFEQLDVSGSLEGTVSSLMDILTMRRPDEGKKISEINLDQEFAGLMEQP